jgi:uncharacterized protein
MIINSSADKSDLLRFFLLVFVLSIPFWLFDVLIQLPKVIPINLPISSLMAFDPLIATTLILTFRYKNSAGLKELVKRAFDYRRIRKKRWYIPIIFLAPAMLFLAYGVAYLTGVPLPELETPILLVAILFPLFFITALGEEVGWLGYAIDPMQDRSGALYASIILGTVWGLWHLWGYIQLNNGLDWAIWQFLGSIPLRILIVWLYNNTGKSILSGVIFHAMINVSEFSFPNFGSHYDPFISAIIFTAVAAIVVFLWSPKTLTRYRCA